MRTAICSALHLHIRDSSSSEDLGGCTSIILTVALCVSIKPIETCTGRSGLIVKPIHDFPHTDIHLLLVGSIGRELGKNGSEDLSERISISNLRKRIKIVSITVCISRCTNHIRIVPVCITLNHSSCLGSKRLIICGPVTHGVVVVKINLFVADICSKFTFGQNHFRIFHCLHKRVKAILIGQAPNLRTLLAPVVMDRLVGIQREGDLEVAHGANRPIIGTGLIAALVARRSTIGNILVQLN